MTEPYELVADFYKGLIAQKIPATVAVELTVEFIKAMFNFAKEQSKQSSVLVDWLKSQNLEKKD